MGDNVQCRDAMQNVLDCLSPSSTVTCTGDGAITSADCEAEWAALVPCLPMI